MQRKYETQYSVVATSKALHLTLIRVVATSEESLISTELEDGEENRKHSET